MYRWLVAAEPQKEVWSPRDLGRAIRHERGRLGISISELARRSGLSQSFLSAVEAGQSDISVGRLIRVAQALGVRFADLIDERLTSGVNVVHAAERRVLPGGDPGLRIAMLAPSLDGTRTYAHCTIDPGATVEPVGLPGRETFIVVGDGAVVLEFADGSSVRLRRGDSVSFPDEEIRTVRNGVPRRSSTFFWLSAPDARRA